MMLIKTRITNMHSVSDISAVSIAELHVKENVLYASKVVTLSLRGHNKHVKHVFINLQG